MKLNDGTSFHLGGGGMSYGYAVCPSASLHFIVSHINCHFTSSLRPPHSASTDLLLGPCLVAGSDDGHTTHPPLCCSLPVTRRLTPKAPTSISWRLIYTVLIGGKGAWWAVLLTTAWVECNLLGSGSSISNAKRERRISTLHIYFLLRKYLYGLWLCWADTARTCIFV